MKNVKDCKSMSYEMNRNFRVKVGRLLVGWSGLVLRAGFLLLRNGYLAKGYDTPVSILSKFAPPSDSNDTSAYVRFVCSAPVLEPMTKITLDSLTFFYLCQKMLYYESHFVLSLEIYEYIVKHFKLWYL